MLARRSKVDPLSDTPLGDDWMVMERELDRTVSAAVVKCFFAYRGQESLRRFDLTDLILQKFFFLSFYYFTNYFSNFLYCCLNAYWHSLSLTLSLSDFVCLPPWLQDVKM